MRIRSWSRSVGIAMLTFGLAACGGGNGFTGSSALTPTSPGGGGGSSATGVPASLNITSAQQSIPADGKSAAALTAVLNDTSGQPISNKTLDFTTNAGSLSNTSVTTNSAGQAVVYLHASKIVGTATVTVSEPTSGLSANVNVSFVSGPATQIQMVLAPAQVAPGATTSVNAQVTDANGNPVSGVAVSFSATTNKSGGQFADSSVVTDTNGRASTTYQAGSTSNVSDILSARLAGGQSSTQTLIVSSTGATAIGNVVLSLGASTAVVSPAPFSSSSATKTAVIATVTDTSGKAIVGQSVTFSTSAGLLQSGSASPSATVSAVTDSNGRATIFQLSPTQTGNATITASIAGYTSSQTISFIPSAPAKVVLSLSPTNLSPGGTATVRATVTDSNGNVVPNTVVTFTSSTAGTSGGAQFSATTVTTDANGNASTQYTAPTKTSITSDTVTAKTAGGQNSNAVTVNISPNNATVTGITLTSATAQVAAGGQVAFHAVVQTSNGVQQGINVNFATSLGTLSSTQASTDSTGTATVNLTAPSQTGTAQVTATVGNYTAQATVTVVAGAPSKVVLSMSPTNLPPGGTASVRATVTDGNGNVVPNTTVTFTSSSAGQSGGAQFSAATVTTDANGNATTQYTAPTNSSISSDTVTAKTAGGLTSNAVTVSVSPNNAVITGLSLSAATAKVNAGGTVAFRAIVTTSGGSQQGINVNFSTSSGALSSTSKGTDSTGTATVTLTAPSQTGTAQVTATVGNYTAQASVQVVAGGASNVVVNVASSPVVPGGTATINTQVFDSQGNPVGSGQQVNFAITSSNSSNSALSAAVAYTDANGNASVNFEAGTALGSATGSETVQVTAGSVNQTATIAIDPSAKHVGGITLAPANASMAVGGSQTVVATVTDANGQPLAGQTINLSSTAGAFASSTGASDANGQVSVTYTAPTTSGAVTLTASSGGYQAHANITVNAGAPATVTVNAAPNAVAPSHVSSITAVVTDTNGNPVPNQAVKFVASAGSFAGSSSTSVTTDANGVATVSLTAPSSAGSVTVTVTATPTSVHGAATLSVSGSAATVGGVTVQALTASIPADGTSQATIRAHVVDASGAAIPDVAVNFTTSAGSLSAASVTTDANGNADVKLTSATVPGTATVTAAVGGYSGQANVQFVAGTPATVLLSLSPPSVATGGTSTVDATVLDAHNNPVPGVTVNFSVPANNSGGQLGNTSVSTDANGIASTTYTAGNITGSVTDSLKATIATSGVSPATASLTVTNPVKTVSLLASSPQLPSGANTSSSSGAVTLTALVKDQNNNSLANIPVQFSAKRDASSACGGGGAIQVVNGTTGADGTATATLYTGGDAANQVIDLTASANGVSTAVTVAETGTHLTLNGPVAVPLNGTATYTVTLLDSGNNPIGGQTVTVTSKLGNAVSSSSLTTDANGQVSFQYTGANSGQDVLSVAVAGCSTYATPATLRVQVAQQNLNVLAPNPDSQIPFSAAPNLSVGAQVANGGAGYVVGDVLTVQGGTYTTPAQLTVSQVGASGAVTEVTVTNAGDYSALPTSPASITGGNGSGATFTVSQNITVQLVGGAVSGQTITFHATRGSLSAGTATTNASGLASVAINQTSANGSAGGAVVTATCTSCSPQLSQSVSVQFNATTSASVSLQASPSTVSIGGTAAITATVRDANDNPVANQQVQFTLIDNSGGSLNASSATTNASGQASITYQAGGASSSAGGVKITGTVGGASGSTSLTVGGQALRIVLGTGNTIHAPNDTQYQDPYSVLVTDSAGNPPPAGSVVHLTTNAVSYQKGVETFTGGAWTPNYAVDCSTDPDCSPVPHGYPVFGCLNEDSKLNGVFTPSEDYNGNGVLDPGNVVSVPASVTLDSNGTGQFFVTYPKNRAKWVEVYLTATIQVAGNQGTTTTTFILPGLASDFNNSGVAPPGQISPYGTANSCSNHN